MRLTRTLLFLAIAAAVGGCDQQSMSNHSANASGENAAPADTSPVVATVNGTPITLNLFEVYQRQRNQGRPGDPHGRDPATVLDEIVNLELATQDGVKQGIDKQPEVAAQIEQQRRAVVASATLQKYLTDHPVTDAEMEAFYKEKTANLGSEYKARHILVADEAKAKDLINELEKGADFGELAKKNSTDSSAANGGELGWFAPQQMVKPFADAVAQMEKGKYTTTPIQTQFGWHVIMLDDKRDITPPPLEQVKQQLQVIMQNQKIQEYVQGLHEQAKIEVNQANLPAAPAAEAPHEDVHEDAEPQQAEAPSAEADQPASEEAPAASSEAPAEDHQHAE